MRLTRFTSRNALSHARDGLSASRPGGLSRLRANTSGTALIEFAISLPVFLTLGMYGTELAYMATVNMQISQMANSVADNASRLGQTDNSTVTPTVTESDIDSVMAGAIEQGANMKFQERGRIILSSLERDPVSGKQFIHWQRCRGDLDKASVYGDDGSHNGLSGPTLTGMGSPSPVTAPTNSAVMFAEVYYDYEGLFGTLFVDDVQFRQEAARIVRDDRNLRDPDQAGVTGGGGSSHC